MMVDPKKLNYYVYLTFGITALLVGLFGVYITLFDFGSVDPGYAPRLLAAPALVAMGLYGIYFAQKNGRDVVEADMSRRK